MRIMIFSRIDNSSSSLKYTKEDIYMSVASGFYRVFIYSFLKRLVKTNFSEETGENDHNSVEF